MRIVMPLPATDFDPTESAIPWTTLTHAGHDVVFATPAGQRAHADERLLSGRGFGPFAGLLRSRRDAIDAYRAMEQDGAYRAPLPWAALATLPCDAVVLPGGHAPGMKPYLESADVRALVLSAMRQARPIAAICHGVLAVARTVDPDTGRSVLWGRRTTALPRGMELAAWTMTGAWLGDYYRTYPEPVEDEVRRALCDRRDFDAGPSHWGPAALLRDTPDRLDRGFFVLDHNYLSARWPGDAHAFSAALLAML
jgi:protease I